RSAFVDIVKTRGFRGLYAGLSLTLVEIVPYAGLQFGTYDTFKRWTMMLNQFRSSSADLYSTDNSLTSFQLFLCGLAAGTCAKLVCHVPKRFCKQHWKTECFGTICVSAFNVQVDRAYMY
ncbi:hypothetical protein ABKV19_000270, partial [Rosa sericea]